jgi:osomolarity two-component system, response regulator SKN7
MPKMDGVSATTRLRQLGNQTLMVAMTSATRPDEIEKYLVIGMDGVIGKPFTKDDLFKTLRVRSYSP